MRIDLELGTIPLAGLLARLRARSIQHNTYAEELFPAVTVADSPRSVLVEILAVAELGFSQGATIDQLVEAARQRGWNACPLEVALQLRLRWSEQPIGDRVTVVSMRPGPDPMAPRGFYLRHDEDGLWLRAYVASDDWVFAPDERIALAR